MRVLCGIDGSQQSFDAVLFAVRLLNPAVDQVGLYYTPPELRFGFGEVVEAATRMQSSLASDVFEQCRNQLPPAFVPRLYTVMGTEKPQYGLPHMAREWQAGMIVVGARGLGAMMRLVLGSVSSNIAQSATVPVLVVRPTPEHRRDDEFRVLFAFDGSTAARHATDFIRQLTWPAETLGRLMTVSESMFSGELPEWMRTQKRDSEIEAMTANWVREHEQEMQQARAELTAQSQKLPPQFHREPLVVEGDPGNEILKAIDQEEGDLVIMGARGLGALQRMLLGSTSQKVLNHASCSVLIVHADEQR